MKIYQLTALLLCSFNALQAVSPLMQAVWDKNLAAVKSELAKEGSNPNEADRQGKTLLMTAAGDGDIEMVRALLDAGAKPNEIDKQGNTAAIHAYINIDNIIARRDKNKKFDTSTLSKILLLLEERGANLELKNKSGKNVFDMAKENTDDIVIAKARKAIASMEGEEKAKKESERELRIAIHDGDVATLKSFIKAGLFDINSDEARQIFYVGLSPGSYPKTVPTLIAVGFDINKKGPNGTTWLMQIAENYPFYKSLAQNALEKASPEGTRKWEWLGRAQRLLDLKPEVNAKNNKGETALDIATRERKAAPLATDRIVSSKMEDLLKKYGAKNGKDVK